MAEATHAPIGPAYFAANGCNASANASWYVVLDFLQNRPKGDEWFCPKVLASKKYLNIPEGTVRRSLKILLEKRLVLRMDKGRLHFYAAARLMDGDFNRLIHAYGTSNKWQVHGLTLKLQAKDVDLEDFSQLIANARPLGGEGWVVRESYGVRDKGLTSFQLSRETLMVWCGCSLEPMDYDRFCLWLKGLDMWLLCHGWARIEGNLRKWSVVEFGLNDDFKVVRVDKGICVTLKSFQGFLARIYDKPELGENIVRQEVHVREERALEDMLGLVSGGMNYAQTMGSLGLIANSLDNNNATQRDMVRAIGQLKDMWGELASAVDVLMKDRDQRLNFKRGRLVKNP